MPRAKTKAVALAPPPFPEYGHDTPYSRIANPIDRASANPRWREHIRLGTTDDPKSLTRFDDDRLKIAYADYLSKTGRKSLAAAYVGFTLGAINRAAKDDPEFGLLIEEAMERWRETVQAEVVRRGMHGVLEAVYYKGVVVGHKRVFSDSLLAMEAKRTDPSYRDSANINVSATAKAGVAVAPPELSQDDWNAQFGHGVVEAEK